MTEAAPSTPPPNLPGIHELLAVVTRLRNPGGCPWDRAQTMASMAPHLVEEAFEAADALRRGVAEEAQEELGDVLVNVAMISQMAREQGTFDVDAVAAAAARKLVRRHPHVFGDKKVDGAEQAYRSWEAKKREERRESPSVLAGVPVALPALLRAFRLGEKAARAGFDWPDREGPRAKVAEELAELDAAITSGDTTATAAELGDLLFSLCNLARHLAVNPEVALANATGRFQRRFSAVEQEFEFRLQGRSLAEMDAAWDRAKQAERGEAH
ncbi:MAG TPA: nucleoside triphosphate pyrophosphohydrolase [Planctomycetota bacterium]|nr:nucleoside triphosphate pyrophosphohydrolase [Planctomycetota bacterium]